MNDTAEKPSQRAATQGSQPRPGHGDRAICRAHRRHPGCHVSNPPPRGRIGPGSQRCPRIIGGIGESGQTINRRGAQILRGRGVLGRRPQPSHETIQREGSWRPTGTALERDIYVVKKATGLIVTIGVHRGNSQRHARTRHCQGKEAPLLAEALCSRVTQRRSSTHGMGTLSERLPLDQPQD